MNEKFDIKRFGQVVSADARNLWPRYGLTMLILVLLPFAVWLLTALISKSATIPTYVRICLITCVVELACCLTPSRMYKNCNLPKEGIYFAMLPASKLEKFLSMMLFCIVVCPLLVLAGSLVLDAILSLIPVGPYKDSTLVFFSDLRKAWLNYVNVCYDPYHGTLLVSPWALVLELILSYLSTVMLFMFTNTIFHKHKVLKTILWCMLISFVLQVIVLPVFIHNVDSIGVWIAEHFQDIPIVWVYVGTLLPSFIFVALLTWWTCHRLQKMTY